MVVDHLERNIDRKEYLEKKNSPESRRNFILSDFASFFRKRKNN
jgi:hypothetical protein